MGKVNVLGAVSLCALVVAVVVPPWQDEARDCCEALSADVDALALEVEADVADLQEQIDVNRQQSLSLDGYLFNFFLVRIGDVEDRLDVLENE